MVALLLNKLGGLLSSGGGEAAIVATAMDGVDNLGPKVVEAVVRGLGDGGSMPLQLKLLFMLAPADEVSRPFPNPDVSEWSEWLDSQMDNE